MKLAIVGAGNIGATLGRKWAAAGHEVIFGVRQADSPTVQALLNEIRGQATAVSMAAAIAAGDVILFAIPYTAVAAVVEANAASLSGKVVIDATNNFGAPVVNNLATITHYAPDAIPYRAFNSLGWENFARPKFGDQTADLFYCGPEDSVRTQVEQLIREIGLRPIYVGGIESAPAVDAIGTLWITLAFRRGMGRRLAFKVLSE